MKTPSVPRVAMNGGSPNCAASPPLIPPASAPHITPIRSATLAGTPAVAASSAMTICARIITAPTERSIPAVSMMTVCPIARQPSTASCCSISEMSSGRRKRGFNASNTAIETTSTITGAPAGCRCSQCRSGRRLLPAGRGEPGSDCPPWRAPSEPSRRSPPSPTGLTRSF